MAAATTIAAVVTAAAALGGATYGVVEGERQGAQQKRALSKQKQAQTDAQAKAAADVAGAERDAKKAERARPDLGSLLTDSQLLAAQGLGATSATGAGGVDPQRLKLSKASLLGS